MRHLFKKKGIKFTIELESHRSTESKSKYKEVCSKLISKDDCSLLFIEYLDSDKVVLIPESKGARHLKPLNNNQSISVNPESETESSKKNSEVSGYPTTSSTSESSIPPKNCFRWGPNARFLPGAEEMLTEEFVPTMLMADIFKELWGELEHDLFDKGEEVVEKEIQKGEEVEKGIQKGEENLENERKGEELETEMSKPVVLTKTEELENEMSKRRRGVVTNLGTYSTGGGI